MIWVAAGLAFAGLVLAQMLLVRVGRGPWVPGYLALLGLAGLGLVGLTGAWLAFRLGPPLDYANAAMLYGALALAYMVTYSALQGDSPTFAILRMVGAAGERGCALADLYARLDDQRLIVARLHDLVVGGFARMVYPVGPTLALTSRGALVARLYIAYRRLLRLEKGG